MRPTGEFGLCVIDNNSVDAELKSGRLKNVYGPVECIDFS